MNYQRIYDEIIDRARNKNRDYGKGIYYERHHIIPKCIGGTGKTHQWRTHTNIIVLTPREHFVCHKILCLLYPNESKLKFALWAMINQRNENRNYKVGSRQYEILKQEYIKLIKGIPKSEQHKQNISKSKLGVKRPPMTDTHRANLKQSITGLAKTSEHKQNLSKTKNIPVVQYTLQGDFIKEWQSAKLAGSSLGIDSSDICSCRVGRRRSAGGFIWKYKTTIKAPLSN